jgi:RNA polymerase sigma-70 factor, ECF subfamily
MWTPWPKPSAEEERSDEELLPAVARGSEAAFLTVYRRRQSALFRYALHLGGDEEIAAEVVQETFLALLRGAGRLDGTKGTVQAWLYAVARNQVMKQLQSQRRHTRLEEEEAESLTAQGCPAAEFEQMERNGRVREALATLPEVYREVLILCDMEDLPYETVASIAECPVGTVRSRLHRGRALLAAKLKLVVGYSL